MLIDKHPQVVWIQINVPGVGLGHNTPGVGLVHNADSKLYIGIYKEKFENLQKNRAIISLQSSLGSALLSLCES